MKSLLVGADACLYWVLSVALLPKKGPPEWLRAELKNPRRAVRWDPGTFSEEARTFKHYRWWLAEWAEPHHDYLSYDEIGGDPELNVAYLGDMRRRGFNPIPVYHKGMPRSLLKEPRVAVGGLVALSDAERITHLDDLFYSDSQQRVEGDAHLLGMGQPRWFERYPATSGDSTTWIPRFPNGQAKTFEEWMREYGERDIPYAPPSQLQGRLAI